MNTPPTTRTFDPPTSFDDHTATVTASGRPPLPPAALEPAVVEYLHAHGYRAERRLGAGGYGRVYLAADAADQLVAVKLLHDYVVNESVLARFRAEARSQGGVRHPGLVRLYHYHPDPHQPFLVTEYIAGGTLQQHLRLHGPMPWKEAVLFLERVARVVQFLHEHDVIHRDIKPSNILREDDGTPKLTDFGLAKRLTDEHPLTRTHKSAGGTPEFGPPEQFRAGARCDERCDVYALAATLYAAVVGAPPFVRDPDDEYGIELITRARTEPVRFPPEVAARLPADLITVCLKGLEKDPRNRFASAAELADELALVAAEKETKSRPLTTLVRSWRRVRGVTRRTWVTAGVVGAVVLAAVLFVLLSQSGPRVIPPPPDPNDTAAQLLQGNRVATLLTADGWPVYQRVALGANKLTPHEKVVGAAKVQNKEHTLILLTENPGVDRYRIRVRLSQDFKGAEVNPAANPEAGVVGVAVGYEAVDYGNEIVLHRATVFGFAEYVPGEAGRGRRVTFRETALLAQALRDFQPVSPQGPSVPLPQREQPRPIRELVLDVTPDGVRASADGGPAVAYPLAAVRTTRDEADGIAANNLEVLKRTAPLLAPKQTAVPARPWTPRTPVGVYARDSWVTVHSFALEPLPPE